MVGLLNKAGLASAGDGKLLTAVTERIAAIVATACFTTDLVQERLQHERKSPPKFSQPASARAA
jgi:hypothetical protein